MLIYGDNLLALKALESKYAGQVKCIHIDPPYNTGSAFAHYNDNFEHSQWLNLMQPRLQIIHSLLSENGTLWISIDDDEGQYLKVLCDEIFGRYNFCKYCDFGKSFLCRMMQNGYLTVTISFWYMPKTKKFGTQFFCAKTKNIRLSSKHIFQQKNTSKSRQGRITYRGVCP